MEKEVKLKKLNKDVIYSWGKAIYAFLREQNPEDYTDYLLPLEDYRDASYNQFVSRLTSLVIDQDLALHDGRVPTEYWLVLAGNTIIGTAKTRYLLDPTFVHEGGHIRLGISKDHRGQGYGHAAMGQLIEYCRRNYLLYDILLTTARRNDPAQCLIEDTGAEWAAAVDSKLRPGVVIYTYWLHLPIK